MPPVVPDFQHPPHDRFLLGHAVLWPDRHIIIPPSRRRFIRFFPVRQANQKGHRIIIRAVMLVTFAHDQIQARGKPRKGQLSVCAGRTPVQIGRAVIDHIRAHLPGQTAPAAGGLSVQTALILPEIPRCGEFHVCRHLRHPVQPEARLGVAPQVADGQGAGPVFNGPIRPDAGGQAQNTKHCTYRCRRCPPQEPFCSCHLKHTCLSDAPGGGGVKVVFLVWISSSVSAVRLGRSAVQTGPAASAPPPPARPEPGQSEWLPR